MFFFLFVALLLNVVSPAVTQNLFLVFFAVANGPLAWSVILLQNKLVFHNFEWSSTLFIHLSPAMASAGIHWNRSEVAETWGERFEATDQTEFSGMDMFLTGEPEERSGTKGGEATKVREITLELGNWKLSFKRRLSAST